MSLIHFLGDKKFYDKKEIKDLLAYLSVILNSGDEISLRRILNVPNRGIGNVTLKKFSDFQGEQSSDTKLTLFESMKQQPQLAGKQEKHIKEFVDLIESLQQFSRKIR